MQDNMHLSIGTTLQGGKYRIERVLGQGGFGITYLAIQVGLNRKVALKEFFMKEYCERSETTSQVTLGSSGSRDMISKYKAKFIKEAQTIAALNHPHIIRIYDIFEEHGTAYYVMEYHDGGSLSDLLQSRKKLSESDSLYYIRQIGSALSYLHERKINHLDIKPGNVLLDDKFSAVLIDFGLSKHYDSGGQQTSSTPIGISHGYAPMEQYKQGGVGIFSSPTDVYALGATLYKLVTGTTPPEASDVNDEGLPALPQSISGSVRLAIERAMQPRRKDRPQTVGEFLALLDGVVVSQEPLVNSDMPSEITVINNDTPSVVPPAPPAPRRSKGVFISLGVAAFVLLLLAVVVFVVRSKNLERLSLEVEYYTALLHEADSLSRNNMDLQGAQAKYVEASIIEDHYKDSRHSSLFSQNAKGSALRIQERLDSIISANQARLSQEQAEADRKVREQVETDRKAKEQKERERLAAGAAHHTTINGLRVIWSSSVTSSQKEILSRLIANMASVTGGSFQMGGSDSGAEYWEKPLHQVTLSDYRICKYEVTQREWVAVMGSNPSWSQGDNLPVEEVSWSECQDFIRELNVLTGLSFRLPTEAEWEFAARGGNRSLGYKYSGGDNLDAVGWDVNNSGEKTHPVGQKVANELGLYDMSGNVFEWCSDWYGEYSSSSQTNPRGPSSGSGRVIRGGCLSFDAGDCRVSSRFSRYPSDDAHIVGFRLAI